MRPLEIRPLRRSTLYQEIVEQLQESILAGELAPGEKLPTERELAQRFGVSRTTVRQALAALEARGLIESHVGSGTYLARSERSFSIAVLAQLLDGARLRLAEALEVRAILEPAVARLAAERATDDDVAQMGEALAKMESGRDPLEHDSAFHAAIAEAARNRLMRTMLQAITSRLRESRQLSLAAPGGLERSLDDHRAILAAIARHDSSGAEAAMREHIRHVEELAAGRLESAERRSAGAGDA